MQSIINHLNGFIMHKNNRVKRNRELRQRMNIWDAFVNHLESTYFPGATELLDKKLIAFEYEAFISCYSY